jgi:hypothetical protein
VVINGRASAPQVARDGAAVAVTKKLTDVDLTEFLSRTRLRGKQKLAQPIPAQDLLQVLQTGATTTAAQIMDERQRQLEEAQRQKRREERKMQMRVRTQIDTAIAARAKKKRAEERRQAEEARAARVRALVQQRQPERERRERENRERITAEHRRMVQAALAQTPGWRARESEPRR